MKMFRRYVSVLLLIAVIFVGGSGFLMMGHDSARHHLHHLHEIFGIIMFISCCIHIFFNYNPLKGHIKAVLARHRSA